MVLGGLGVAQAPLDGQGLSFASPSNGGPGNGIPPPNFVGMNSGIPINMARVQANGDGFGGSNGAEQAQRDLMEGRGADSNSNKTNGTGEVIGRNEEHGEVNGGGEPKKDAGNGEDDMELDGPPKDDPMVDYTDEFGRVRTMRQRCATYPLAQTFRHDT